MRFTHATASRIKSYKECEFKYFLEYDIEYPPMKGDNIYSGKGSAIHEALEAWTNAKLGIEAVEGGPPVEIDWEKTLQKYYEESELWKLDHRMPGKDGKPKGHPHPVEKTCESCPWASKDGLCEIANKAIDVVEGCPGPNFQEDWDLVLKTLNRTDYNPLALDEDGNFKKKIIGAEVPFDMKLDGVRVRGIIDLVFEDDPNTLEICDYKSGRAMSYDKAFNDAQVRIYRKVARILWPHYENVLVTLHYLKTRPVTVCFDEHDDEMTMKSLKKKAKEIAGNLNPRRQKGWLCPYCVGYDNCGKIKDKFKVEGRFRLPTISCEFANAKTEEPCWGNPHPIKGLDVTIDTADKIKYLCSGHKQMSEEDGKYEKRPHDSSEPK